jgi:hypothetical protein
MSYLLFYIKYTNFLIQPINKIHHIYELTRQNKLTQTNLKQNFKITNSKPN